MNLFELARTFIQSLDHVQLALLCLVAGIPAAKIAEWATTPRLVGSSSIFRSSTVLPKDYAKAA